MVLPEPASAVGDILVDGDEIPRLIALDRVLGPLIDRLGDAPDSVYLADPAWPDVVAAARKLLPAMVLAGGL